jgi:3-oxoacyl-[acyl-carrier protein] reductase
MTAREARFTSRTAVVTGGASGLGLACARRIVAEGGKVVIWDNNPATLENARRESGAAAALAVDVADPHAVAAAASESRGILGRIDILITSAGITGATAPVTDFPIDVWQRVIDVNLNGTFYCCRAIAPIMVEGGYGRIVNVSSVAGKEGNPNASAYSTSKAGVIGFTKSLGKELATKGIMVNAITPAAAKTAMFATMTQSHIDFMLSKIPMGRFLEVNEAAAMIAWLASEDCSFTTGAVFDLSGGRATY